MYVSGVISGDNFIFFVPCPQVPGLVQFDVCRESWLLWCMYAAGTPMWYVYGQTAMTIFWGSLAGPLGEVRVGKPHLTTSLLFRCAYPTNGKQIITGRKPVQMHRVQLLHRNRISKFEKVATYTYT